MNFKKLLTHLKYFFIIPFFLLFFVFFKNIHLNESFTYILHLKPYQITLILLFYLIINLNLITKNYYLLRIVGKRPNFKNIVLIYFSSLIAHQVTPGKIGYPVTAYLLKKIEKIEYTSSSVALTVDFFIGVFLIGAIAFAGSIIYFQDNIGFFLKGFLLVPLVLLFSLLIKVNFKKIKKGNKIKAVMKRLKESFDKISITKYIVIILFHFINVFLNAILLSLIIFFFGSNIPFWKTMIADTSSFILGALSMIPLGLGVQDVSMIFFLEKFGLIQEKAIATVFIQRGLTIGVNYIFGFLSSILLGLHTIREKN